jgi:hypothetical protein
MTTKSIDILVPTTPINLTREIATARPAKPFRRRLPRYILRIMVIFFILNTVLVALQGLGLALALLGTTTGAISIVILGLVALLGFLPAVLAVLAIPRLKPLRIARSRWQFWARPALYFAIGLALPWLTLVIAAGLDGIALRLLGLSVS